MTSPANNVKRLSQTKKKPLHVGSQPNRLSEAGLSLNCPFSNLILPEQDEFEVFQKQSYRPTSPIFGILSRQQARGQFFSESTGLPVKNNEISESSNLVECKCGQDRGREYCNEWEHIHGLEGKAHHRHQSVQQRYSTSQEPQLRRNSLNRKRSVPARLVHTNNAILQVGPGHKNTLGLIFTNSSHCGPAVSPQTPTLGSAGPTSFITKQTDQREMSPCLRVDTNDYRIGPLSNACISAADGSSEHVKTNRLRRATEKSRSIHESRPLLSPVTLGALDTARTVIDKGKRIGKNTDYRYPTSIASSGPRALKRPLVQPLPSLPINLVESLGNTQKALIAENHETARNFPSECSLRLSPPDECFRSFGLDGSMRRNSYKELYRVRSFKRTTKGVINLVGQSNR